MSATQDAWKEVASKAEGIGLKLKLHLDQENDDSSEKQPGDTETAVADLSQRLQDAFDAFGRAAKDPAVHSDVKEMGNSLLNAMSLTFHSVGATVSSAARNAAGAADPDIPEGKTGTIGESDSSGTSDA